MSKIKKAQKVLLHGLILSDFLILLKKNASTHSYADNLLKNGAIIFAYLNLFEQAQALKLLARMLRFLKCLRTKRLVFFTSNNFQSDLFSQLFQKRQYITNSVVSTYLPKYKKSMRAFSHLFINCTDVQLSTKVLRVLFNNCYFLFQRVNSYIAKTKINEYLLYNNLDDSKKIIFLSLFFIRMLNKIKKRKSDAKIKKIQCIKA